MSSEQMKALLASVTADPEAAKRLTAATTVADVVAIAADLGYEISADDVESAVTAMQGGEVSDTELAQVAGGGDPTSDPALCVTGHCHSQYGLACH